MKAIAFGFGRYALGFCAVAGVLAGCGGSQPPIGALGAMPQSRIRNVVPQWQAMHLARTACPQVVGRPTCLALMIQKHGVTPLCSPSSSCGFTPQQLETAYKLTNELGNGSGPLSLKCARGNSTGHMCEVGRCSVAP